MRSVRAIVLYVSVLALFATSAPHPAEARRPSALLLTADAVVPGPGDTSASGSFKVSTSRGEVCFETSVQNLSGYITRIAIRRGFAGSTGPEVVVLTPNSIGILGLNGCAAADRALLREISRSPGEFYYLVTTSTHPGGALRGQLRQ